MFSKQITTSDAFVDMPLSSQVLYFHLNMEADDDGFVANPNRITRIIGANNDDLKILLAKRFLLAFESGVVVIKHWLLHNAVRRDVYRETQYLDEKKTLTIKDNNVYSDGRNDSVTIPLHRLDKIRLDKIRLDKDNAEPSSADTILLLDMFLTINPAIKRMYGNTTQRKACRGLIDTYGLERLKLIITETLPKTNGLQYFPTITTPLQLQDKYVQLESAIKKYQSEKLKAKRGVADINKKNDIQNYIG